jgi:hypothetical protein
MLTELTALHRQTADHDPERNVDFGHHRHRGFSLFLLALETQSVALTIICLKFSAKASGNVRLCVAPTPAHLEEGLSLVTRIVMIAFDMLYLNGHDLRGCRCIGGGISSRSRPAETEMHCHS